MLFISVHYHPHPAHTLLLWQSTWHSAVTDLGGGRPWVRWESLTLSNKHGGLAVPDICLCIYTYHWYYPDARIPYIRPERAQLDGFLHSQILPRGIPFKMLDIQTVSTTCWPWRRLGHTLQGGPLYSDVIPIADNPWIPPTRRHWSKVHFTDT